MIRSNTGTKRVGVLVACLIATCLSIGHTRADDDLLISEDAARRIAHSALSKALAEEYNEDARAMLSDRPDDKRLLVRRDEWKVPDKGNRQTWLAMLEAIEGRYCGIVIIDALDRSIIKLAISTKAGRAAAMKAVQQWIIKRGPPKTIEWLGGQYRMEWQVSKGEMQLLGPFIITVSPGHKPYIHPRR